MVELTSPSSLTLEFTFSTTTFSKEKTLESGVKTRVSLLSTIEEGWEMDKTKWPNGWVPFYCVPFPSSCTCQQVKAREVTKSGKPSLTLLVQKLPLVAMVAQCHYTGTFGATVYATSPDLKSFDCRSSALGRVFFPT